MRRATPLLLILALAGAIAVCVSLNSSDEAPVTNDEVVALTPSWPAAEPAPRRRVVDESAEPFVDVPAPPRFVEDADAPPAPSADALGPTGRSTDRRGVEVLVIDGSTGAVLPDVRVHRGDAGGPLAADSKLSVSADDQAAIEFHIEAPEGFGGLETVAWGGPVASRATSVRFALPVFPLGDVALQFVDEAGDPVVGVTDVRATVRNPWNGHNESVTVRASPSDADGATSLRLPRIPFQDFALHAAKRIAGDMEHKIGARFVVRPSDFGAATRTVVLFEHTPDGASCGDRAGRSCGPYHEPAGPKAPLVVRLIHGDEKPAARVTVRLDDGSYLRATSEDDGYLRATSDDDGVARFAALTTGDRKFVASAHGFRPTPFRAQVGRVAEIVVRETPARTVEVIVVDADDHRLPAACVTSRCVSVVGPDGKKTYVGGWCSVAQLDGDVEFATPLTGADGTLRLQEPLGEIEYRAQLGGAVVCVKSAADVVRIVLKKE